MKSTHQASSSAQHTLRSAALASAVAGFLWLALPAAQAQYQTVPGPDYEKCTQTDMRLMFRQDAAGNAQAQFCVGYYYMVGWGGVREDHEEAAAHFRRSAEQGYAPAEHSMGKFYKHGMGVQKDLREAEIWYRRAAEQGDPGAENDLAILLLEAGRKEEALRWVRAADAQHFPQAFNLLAAIRKSEQPTRKEPSADLFEQGTKLYRAGDQAAAARNFLAAARAGNSLAQLQIGWHYEKGEGVPQNWAEAAVWYRKSAEQGNATAMKNLGQSYELGLGVGENWMEAARLYNQSAQLGDANGESALARAYQFGIGVPQNRQLAILWDQRAAAQDNPGSRYFARWLADPTNNIGFRNQQEQQLVIAGRLRFGGTLIGGDPYGILFHSSAERTAWLLFQRRQLDLDEATTMWRIAKTEFDQCQRNHEDSCWNPGPAPR